MTNRKLALNAERLIELTTDELVGVAGGVRATPLCITDYPTVDVNRCPTLFC